MLSRRIALSKKVNSVSDRAALLYTWMLPFTDDYGNLEYDAEVIRAQVVPMRKGWSEKVVGALLEELEMAKAITPYYVQGQCFFHVENFEEFQTFKNDRAKRADYPLPDNSLDSELDSLDSDMYSSEPLREAKSKRSISLREREEGTSEDIPVLNYIRDIQHFTNRPPATSRKMGTPDYRATLYEIGKLIDEHGYDLILALSAKIHRDEGMYSVFQFEWKLREMLKTSDYVLVWDAEGKEIMDVWDAEDWKAGCKTVERKGDKTCLKS